MLKYLQPQGQIGIVIPGLLKELPDDVPDYLKPFLEFHTLSWWQHHWSKTGLVNIDTAIMHPYGWQEWRYFLQTGIDGNLAQKRDLDDFDMLLKDKGNYLGFIQLIATKL